MIKNTESLSMAEATKYIKGETEGEQEFLKFIKKFVKIDSKKAEELRVDLEGLNLMKVREDHLAKVLDILPDNRENLNKIFNDVSLDEDETNKLLETIKKYR